MGARRWVRAWHTMPLLLLILTACAVTHTPPLSRIALLAPFEGRYREIGYDALYAARLALAESGRANIDLLAVDDGGTARIALDRAHALADDPLVKAVILLGYDVITPEVQSALSDVPALIVGHWGAQPISDNVFMLSNPAIADELTIPPNISVTDAAREPHPLVGSEIFALNGFRQLTSDLEGVTILSSGVLPGAEFSERYRSSDPFAPAPGIFAPLTYNAMHIALLALNESRTATRDSIAAIDYNGINGRIRFENGYWVDAPIHRYIYRDGQLSDAP